MEGKPSAPYDAPPPYPGYQPANMPPPGAQMGPPQPGFQPQPAANQPWMSGYQSGHQQGYPQSGPPPPPPPSTAPANFPQPVSGYMPYNPNATPMQAGAIPVQPGVKIVTVVPLQNFGPHPVQVTCPKCGAQVMTSTKSQSGLITYLSCGLCILFGCVFGCCLVPFCMSDLQDTEHFCPNCNSFLGAFRRL